MNSLNIDRTVYRINRARELGQGAVAHKPNDATAIFREQRFENYFAVVSQRGHDTGVAP